MINLLFIAKNTSNLIIKNYSYLESELRKLTNLMVWSQPGDIKDILTQIPAQPDFILIANDLGGFFPFVKGFSECDIPVGMFINDVHRFVKERETYIIENDIKYLFSVIKENFMKTYPNFKDRFEWFPHYINPDIYKDYGLTKDVDMLLMGETGSYYPLRNAIYHFYHNKPGFVYHRHPGYRSFTSTDEKNLLITENYAKEINKSKIFFTCCSILQYPVLKYFETLACKTLLLAPTFNELEDLGFIPGTHFVSINYSNFAERVEYYLNNENERLIIIEEGHNFIMKNHTVEIRARQLVERIQNIITSSKMN